MKMYFLFFNSLGHTNYLSLIKLSDMVIGNSSSGIIEAPYLNTPTLNIGTDSLVEKCLPLYLMLNQT